MVASASASRMPQRPKATLRPAGEVEGVPVSRGRARASADLPEIISLRSRDDDEDERIDLFRIDGTVYTMSVRPKANASLKYAWIAREQGLQAAAGYALEALIGAEGYQALMEFDGLTPEALDQIVSAASKIMAGAAEPGDDEEDDEADEPARPKASRRRA
jgi:hypothetical protein